MKMISEKSEQTKMERFFRATNRFLIALIIILSGHVLLKYFAIEENRAVIISDDKTISENTLASSLIIDESKPVDMYVKAVEARDLFQSFSDKFKAEMPALQKALPALHERIKLIGILVDDDSKAIVEDLKEKQTHFLSRGESLGAVFLEDIQEDKVIFVYNNEKIEMAP